MKKVSKYIVMTIIGLLAIAGVVGAIGLLNGSLAVSKDTHPPCDQLPTVEEATLAINTHQDFVHDIEALGKGISVEVGKPCSKDENRGLILVHYETSLEREAIVNLLKNNDGFGVPVHLEKH